MNLQIITPDKLVYSGQASLVQVPGRKGSFAILENHAPIISSLGEGVLRYIESGGREIKLSLSGGVVEVLKNDVTILAERVTVG